MSEMKIADRADEAAHEAVLELIKTAQLQNNVIGRNGFGKEVAANLIDLHKELAAYYRTLESDY